MKKIKSYSFWINVLTAIALLVSVAGQLFGFKVLDIPSANEIVAVICGILLFAGVLVRDEPGGEGPDAEIPGAEDAGAEDTGEDDKN